MPVDLLIYMIIAAGLIIWLRNTLGTRHGSERQRPNPLAEARENASLEKGSIVDITDSVKSEELPVLQGVDMRHEGVAKGLHDIMRADRSFNPQRFLTGSKDAFAMIVEAFSDGDVETLRPLLSPDVFAAFHKVILDRAEIGETVKTEIHAVRRAEVLDARLTDRMAFVKIRFTAQETCVVRDRDGNILSGHPDRVTDMTDVWTFGRDVRSKDPTWFLYETADDAPEDNKTLIPNVG